MRINAKLSATLTLLGAALVSYAAWAADITGATKAEKMADARWAVSDTDKDGKLSESEFEATALQRTRARFKQLDKNHDGKIERAEMQAERAARAAKHEQNAKKASSAK